MSAHISGIKVRKQLRNILNQQLKTNLDYNFTVGTQIPVSQILQQLLLQPLLLVQYQFQDGKCCAILEIVEVSHTEGLVSMLTTFLLPFFFFW